MEPHESLSNGGDDTSSSAVQVAVRVRPLSAGERAQGSEPCVAVLGVASVAVGGLSGKQYDFDAAFPPEIPQQDVYETLVRPLVDRFFDGYNATVFAYGQTGSGKTFTMGNEFKLSVAPVDRGIIPRTMDEIFQRIQTTEDGISKYVLKVSYLEILNEEIHDLLSPGSATASLSVRDDGKRGICVNGLSEHGVSTLDEVATLLHTGALSRATAATTMNAQSSRSHAICTLTMEQFETSGDGGAKFSKFHLVDLAGSERAKRTHAEGARFKEGVNINRGLLSLGNVINALSERQAHVPYRDSKLTRLLQDSLGGNSKTLMIACISPADVNFEETCNTLRYASRARNIQNQAVVNQTMTAENQVAYLKQQLEVLQLQLLQQQQQGKGGGLTTTSGSGGSSANVSSFEVEILEKEIQRWKAIARTREEELQLVMSAKDKWKKIADEFVAKKQHQQQQPQRASGPVRVNTVTGDCYSPKSKALLQDAIEFDKSVQVTKFSPPTPAKTASSSNNDSEGTSETDSGEGKLVASWEKDIDSLEDVIKEKEKIVLALSQASASASSSGEKHGPLTALSKGYEQKIRELESQVAKLVEEKKRLAADKLAGKAEMTSSNGETPQRRLQTQLQLVQSQLQVARHAERECKRLAQLWKTGSLKISTLEREITDMKKQKATLQRQLKEESETHRKEKREQSLQIVQLKRQEQRKQYELQKLTTLHAKQNGVLKRKSEEIAAVNKRMRTMVQTQQSAQQMRMQSKGRLQSSSSMAMAASRATSGQEKQSTTDTNDSETMAAITKALKETLAVQMTIAGAKNAIQMELDDRKKLALEIARLEKGNETATAAMAKLDELKASLKEKNADIRQLQQKLASVEKNNALPSTLFPTKVSLCHQLIRQLMDTVFESKMATQELQNCKTDLEAVEEQLVEQAQRHEETVTAYKKQLVKLGHFEDVTASGFESKTSESEVERLKNELTAMRAELEKARAQAATSTAASPVEKQKKAPVKKKTTKPRDEAVDLDEIFSSDDDEEEEEDDDSDYIEEEDAAVAGASKRKKSNQLGGGGAVGSSSGGGRVRQPLKPRALEATASTINAMDEINLLLSKPSAVGGTVCCSCNGKCATKSCACRAEKQSCGPECSCKETKCHNRGDAATKASGATKTKKRRSDPLATDRENEVESFFDLSTDKENLQPTMSMAVDKENTPPATHTTKLKKLWSGSGSGSSFLAKPSTSASTSSLHSSAIARFF